MPFALQAIRTMSTSTSTTSSAQDWGLPPNAHSRFTVEQYLELARQDRLGDVPCELLEGWIVPKVEGSIEQLEGWDFPQMVRSTFHDGMLDRVEALLREMTPAGWYVRTQRAMVTTESVPEPDVAMLRGSLEKYFRKFPEGRDIAVAIEVSLSTLTNDRRKARVYARSGVPTYVIVNLRDRCLEVFDSLSTDSSGVLTYAPKRVLRGREVCNISVDNMIVGNLTCDQVFKDFPSDTDPT